MESKQGNRAGLFFRRLTLVCLLGEIAIAALAIFNQLSAPVTGVAATALALMLFLFDALADEPQDLESLEKGVNRLLELEAASGAAGEDGLSKDELVAKLQASPQLMELISQRSDQIYLLKQRGYLIRQIKDQYDQSLLPALVDELQEVEAQLEVLGVEYIALEVPERFRLLINRFDRQKRLNIYYTVIDTLRFLPFKGLIKLYLRLTL